MPLDGSCKRIRALFIARNHWGVRTDSGPIEEVVASLAHIHVQDLASLCRIFGHEIEDHKRKVDTKHFVSEIH